MRQTAFSMFIKTLSGMLAAYAVAGVVFAAGFVTRGVGRIDPHAIRGSWGFRLSILPGTIALWPWLAWRWLTGVRRPPEEVTAHRRLAGSGGES